MVCLGLTLLNAPQKAKCDVIAGEDIAGGSGSTTCGLLPNQSGADSTGAFGSAPPMSAVHVDDLHRGELHRLPRPAHSRIHMRGLEEHRNDRQR